MWVILAAPWSAHPSRCAASALLNCWKAALQHDYATASPLLATRFFRCTLVDCIAAEDPACQAVGSSPHHRSAADGSPILLSRPAAQAAANRSTASLSAPTCLPPPAAVVPYTTDASALALPAPPLPPPAAAPPPSPPSSKPILMAASSGSPFHPPADQRPTADGTAAPAAAATPTGSAPGPWPCPGPGADAGPGPSSAVLQLMGHIRRSRSAVDLRLLLSQHAPAVDHLALVAAMTRLTQLAETSRRPADRAAQRELLSELSAALVVSEHLRRCGARQLGTCLHSFAALGVRPEERLLEAVLDALSEDGAALLREGNGADVSVVALALARLNCSSRRAWRALARGVEAHWGAMSPQHVANTLSALARGGAHEHRDAFARLLRRAASEADKETFSGRNLANALWAAVRHLEALGVLEQQPSARDADADASGDDGVKVKKDGTAKVPGSSTGVDEVAAYATALARHMVPARLRQCPPTELAGVAWSLSRLGWTEGAAWEGLGAQLRLNAGALKPTELCTTAEALQAACARIASASITSNAASSSAIQPSAPLSLSSTAPEEEPGVAATAAAAAGSPAPEAADGTAAPGSTGQAAATAASAAAAAPQVDPGEHLSSLFAAASLRIRDLRPQHLAPLLRVLRRRAEMQRRNAAPVAGGAMSLAGRGPGQRGAEEQEPVLVAFAEAARAQLLRSAPSAFPDLAVVASLVSDLTSLTNLIRQGSQQDPPSTRTNAAPTSPASSPTTAQAAAGSCPAEPRNRGATAAGSSGAAAAALASAAPTPAAAVLDHLAAAAAPLAAAASASELRLVIAAFAAAGHLSSELCTAVAARVETVARQIDISRIAADVQASAPRWMHRQLHQRQLHPRLHEPSWAAAAAVREVVELLGALQALAQLGFHNEAALDAAQPAVAMAAAALPPLSLAAALGAYAASGAPPLALASSLAAELLRRFRWDRLLPAPVLRRQGLNREQQQQVEVQVEVGERSGEAGRREGSEGPSRFGEEEAGMILAACRQWRASLLYPAGLTGAASGCLNVAGGSGSVYPRGFDMCSELMLSLRTTNDDDRL